MPGLAQLEGEPSSPASESDDEASPAVEAEASTIDGAAETAVETPLSGSGDAPTEGTDREAELMAKLEDIQRQLEALSARLDDGDADSVPSSVDDGAVGGPLSRKRWYLGGTVGVGFDNGNNTRRLLDTAVDDRRNQLELSAQAGRVLVPDSLALGVWVGATRAKVSGEFETDSGLQDRDNLEYELSFGPTLRGFIGLGDGSRVFVFYDTVLAFGMGESIRRTFTDSDSTVTVADSYSLSLGLRPGIMFFATPGFAIEVGVEVLGVRVQWDKVTTDYSDQSTRLQADVDLNLNILSLSFAFVGYFR